MVIYVALQKNDNIELKIESVTSQGSGIGHHERMAVFVYGTVPGDVITAHIIKVKKNYAIGIIGEIITEGESRIKSACPVSERCGGCAFRNMTYEEELRGKKNRVQDAVKRIGHIDVEVEEIIGADSTDRYRNKAQYPVRIKDGELEAGFYAINSHRIIPCKGGDCLLSPAEFAKGIDAFAKWAKAENLTSFDERTGRGYLRHIYFRKAFATGEFMACAVVNSETAENPDLLVSLLRENIENLRSVQFNFNTANTNVILGERTETVWGSDTICDTLLGRKFQISADSFYQVNHDQCEKLYTVAKEFADFRGDEVLLDLYCGVGTIGITMADGVKQLVGIEIVPKAIENARANAKLNNIENAEFICADASQGAAELERRGIKPDVIILDPPRKGCDEALLDTVVKMSPERIVYVSCDSATFARDAAILSSKGYAVKRLKAVDMFPRTTHVEAVSLLTKNHD